MLKKKKKVSHHLPWVNSRKGHDYYLCAKILLQSVVCNYFNPRKLSTTVVGGMRVDSNILHEINSRLNIPRVNIYEWAMCCLSEAGLKHRVIWAMKRTQMMLSCFCLKLHTKPHVSSLMENKLTSEIVLCDINKCYWLIGQIIFIKTRMGTCS